jgi:hypothetical protein
MIFEKWKDAKTGSNMAEPSKEIGGSKRALLSMMMIIMIMAWKWPY